MKNLFVLKSNDCELLAFVAGKLVKEDIEFSFEEVKEGEFALTSEDSYSLDYFADAFVCNCDASSKYRITQFKPL